MRFHSRFALTALLLSVLLPMRTPAQEPPLPPIDAQERVLLLPEIPSGSGAESWYYEAKRLEEDHSAEKNAELYRALLELAFDFGEPVAAKEAGKALLASYKSSGDTAQARRIAERWMEFFGPEWSMYQLVLSAQLAESDSRGALATIESISKNLPATAKSKSTELSYYTYSAKYALGDFTWTQSALSVLPALSIDSWTAKSLRLAAAVPGVDPQTAALALMRAEFAEKKYDAAAAKAVEAANLLRAPGAQRQLLSEAGRAFASSTSPQAGAEFFADFFRSAGDPFPDPDFVSGTVLAGKEKPNLWIAAYYLARCWALSGRDFEGGILFLGLTESAPSAADSDGALWYWLDITMRRIEREEMDGSKRALQFAALAEASKRWKNPTNFDDLVDEFDRTLLREKSWNDVLALRTLAGGTVSQGLKTRLSYQSARLAEEKLADPSLFNGGTDSYATDVFRTILADGGAEDYYRTMAAWRLRERPLYVASMPDLSGSSAVFDSMQKARAALSAPGPGEPASLRLAWEYLERDLDGSAARKALELIGSLDAGREASLAFEFSARSEHYAALRFARDSLAKGGGKEYPALYGLLYPLAWEGLVAQAASIASIPKALAYGIVRSESVFDPEAVSYAGAVGLAQLMPATAAETARGLKMPSYALTDPEDNLTIGFTYYSYMLARFGARPVRAMFAYNAGPGRMMAWAKESGELPDDLLLETLNIAQPRQYAKNIIHAALAYGVIHYSIDPLEMLDYLLTGKPLAPAPATPEPVAASPAPEVPALPAEAPPSGDSAQFLGNDPR